MEYRELGRTGLKVSRLGYGAAALGGVYGALDEATGIRAVHTALDLGMNLIDVAPYYGATKAETVLGKALVGVPRARYYLATKMGRYGLNDFDFSAARVVSSVDESLQRLGVGYIDLIQCHDIEFTHLDQIVNETLPALEKLRTAGKVRFIGITGLPLKIFPYVLERAPVDTVLSYCHYNLQNSALSDLLPLCQAKGVGVLNAAPTGMGLLTKHGVPPWHLASAELRATCAEAVAYCEAHGRNIVELAVQFAIVNPAIASTIVGSADPAEIEKDVAWMEQPLDQELLRQVETILAPVHNQMWQSGLPENN